jgi:hypothetical protein
LAGHGRQRKALPTAAPPPPDLDRSPLLASTAVAALSAALEYYHNPAYLSTPVNQRIFRNHLLVVFGFAFLFRADTITHITVGDVYQCHPGGLNALLRVEKGRGHLESRLASRPAECMGGWLWPLCALWLRVRAQLGKDWEDASSPFWALPGDNMRTASATLTTFWLQESLALLQPDAAACVPTNFISPRGTFCGVSLCEQVFKVFRRTSGGGAAAADWE